MASMRIAVFTGFIEKAINIIGSRDMTLVERFQRLGDYAQRDLGLPDKLMPGWKEAIEQLIMEPPERLTTTMQAIAMVMILRDAEVGQYSFDIIVDDHYLECVEPIFAHLNLASAAKDFVHSKIAGLESPTKSIDWGYLDINQIETLLFNAFGNDSFKEKRTAVIAGRLSNMARQEAESALIDVGIDTQNSISHNIDYLIIGSKGTGGTKHEKVERLQNLGQNIKILDEEGFEALLRSPKPPREDWRESEKMRYEDLVSALRHVWAFEQDLYCIVYEYDPDQQALEDDEF